MEQMVQNWANRYYYTGMGLPAPATLPANNKYEEGFELNLSAPVAKLLKKDKVTLDEVAEFLRTYQQLGVKSPFYTLSYFADNYNGGDWESEVKAMLEKLNIVVAVVKDGKAMYVYMKDGKIVGTFPRTPHYICSKEMAAQGEDIINTLLFKDGATLTNEEIEALRRLSRISTEYASSIKDVPMEHQDGDRISGAPINPLHPGFPPYEVRQLFSNLPTANVFPTKHQQAWEYVKQSKDADPVAKKYLERLERLYNIPENTTVASEPLTVSTPIGDVQVSPDFAQKMQGSLVGFPDSNEVFSDIGEMLSYLIREDYIKPGWSIKDTIHYYSLPDADPYIPENRYDFDAGKVTLDNKWILYLALKDIMQRVENPQRPMTVEHLLNELDSDKDTIESQNTWDILHSCMILLNVNNNRDVASLKGKERSFDQQLQRQAMNFIKQGFDGALTLQEAAAGQTEHDASSMSIEKVVEAALASGMPRDLTLGDISNGLMTPMKKHEVTLEAMLTSQYLSPQEKDRLSGLLDMKKKLDEIHTIDDLLESDVLPGDAVSSISMSMAESDVEPEYITTGSVEDLIKDSRLAPEVQQLIGNMYQRDKHYDTLMDSIGIDRTVEPNAAIDAAIVKVREMHGICDALTEVSADNVTQLIDYEHLPKDARAMIEKVYRTNLHYKQLLAAIPVGPKAEPCQDLEAALQRFREMSTSNNNSPSGDFGKDAAIAMLSDIRDGLAETDKLPFAEAMAARGAYVPVYYAFVRLVGCSEKDLKDMIEYLTDQRDKATIQKTKDIFNHGIEVLSTYM